MVGRFWSLVLVALVMSAWGSSTPAGAPSQTRTAVEAAPAETQTSAAAAETDAETDAQALLEFVTVDPADDGPFSMVNLIEYRDEARYEDGRATDLTGREADDIYGRWVMNEKLPAIGAEIVYAPPSKTT